MLASLEREPLVFARRQAPAGAKLHVEVHLDVEDCRQPRRPLTHVGEARRLVNGEGIGPRKFDKEQVVLDEVVPEGGLRQRAVRHGVGEGMLDVGAPLGFACRLQPLKEAHCVLPRLSAGPLCMSVVPQYSCRSCCVAESFRRWHFLSYALATKLPGGASSVLHLATHQADTARNYNFAP